MTPCSVAFCAALATEAGGFCAVHRRHPALHPEAGKPAASKECESCGGTGECFECDGAGEVECNLGHEHDCDDCDGSGLCPDCCD